MMQLASTAFPRVESGVSNSRCKCAPVVCFRNTAVMRTSNGQVGGGSALIRGNSTA